MNCVSGLLAQDLLYPLAKKTLCKIAFYANLPPKKKGGVMKKLLAVLAVFVMTVSCSSDTNTSGSDTVNPTVPDFSAASKEILPVMNETLPSISSPLFKAIDFAPDSWWADDVVFKWMSDHALSTDPAAGTESIFNFVDEIQNWVTTLSAANAFIITNNTCQLPEIDGVAGTATHLTGEDLVTLPYLSVAADSDYDCLVTFTRPPTGGLTTLSYAFNNAIDSIGRTYLKRLALAMTSDFAGSGETNYTVFIAEYNYSHSEFDVSFVTFVDKASPFAMKALYNGDSNAHSFTFRSTMRGPLTLCNPVATDIEDEAKKLGAVGISTGSDSGFMMKLQRVCDQKAPITSTDPQYFCIDATTKGLAADQSICDSYESDMESMSLMQAESVPFAATDFANGNVITTTKRSWATVGGGYLSTNFPGLSEMAFDTASNTVYVAYLNGDGKVTVVRSVADAAWETIGDFTQHVDSAVDITVADGVPYVAFNVTTPGVPETKLVRYVDGSWETVSEGITGRRNIQLLYEAPYVYLGRTEATAYGRVYISKYNTTTGEWTTLKDGSSNWMSLSTSYKYAMAVYEGTVYVAVAKNGVTVKKCESGCTSWTGLSSIYPLTTTIPESLAMTATLDGPRVAYALTASPWLQVYLYWDGAWRRLAGLPDTVFHNLNGIHLASQYSEDFIAFEDAENDGHLVVERFRATGWETMGSSSINISNTYVEDFNVIESVAYLLYEDPTEHKLILKKFE